MQSSSTISKKRKSDSLTLDSEQKDAELSPPIKRAKTSEQLIPESQQPKGVSQVSFKKVVA